MRVSDSSSPHPASNTAERTPAPAGFRLGYISLLAAVVGVLAGIVAFLLYNLIGLFTNLAFYHVWSFHFRSPAENQLGAWVIVIPVIGGIIVAFMAKYGSLKIKGHGIPEAMEAVLTSKSRIEAKLVILKPISAAIAIGTGGPFGAEGPIIQTGGALGSLVGQIVSTTASERKVLLACGAGAGMAATFNTPIAGVILAIELLLFEFRGRSFIPLVIATTIATSIRQLLLGTGTMFRVLPMDFDIPRALPYTSFSDSCAAQLPSASRKRFISWRIISTSFRFPSSGTLRLAHLRWESLDFSSRACSGWGTTPFRIF
jgi:chloride channel protein, CIC family